METVFESGLQHFADRVSGYTGLPAGPRTFLQQVPSTWDETCFVDGAPGEWVVLARRKGTIWYLAGIAGDAQPRSLMVELGFLGAGPHTAQVIADGGSNSTFAERSVAVTASAPLEVSLRGRGGFVARITPG